LVRTLDQIFRLGLRHKSSVGLQHVEYNAYKFFSDMAESHVEVFAFLPLFQQIVVERPVTHGYQPRGLQDSPSQVS